MAKQDRFASKAQSTITVNGTEFQRRKDGAKFSQRDLKRLLSEYEQCNAFGNDQLVIVADRSVVAALLAKGVTAVHPDDLLQDPQDPNIFHYPIRTRSGPMATD